MVYAPIVLFVYNRPSHTKRTVEALKNNIFAKFSNLIIYSDGPKNFIDEENVSTVRKYLSVITGFKSIAVKKQKKNIGLANSIISGVSTVIRTYGSVIVLEDDLVTSKYFLQFMNLALDKYKNKKQVISIHGYAYPFTGKNPETYFLKGADCWGWGTWKRGWDLFETNGKKLLRTIQDRKLVNEFTLQGSYDYMSMLKNQIQGNIDSWAVRWLASAIVADKLTLYPGKSLVRNIGFDKSGVHCEKSETYSVGVSKFPVHVGNIAIEENQIMKQKLITFYREHDRTSMLERSLNALLLEVRRSIEQMKGL
jgi:hypothetical protein